MNFVQQLEESLRDLAAEARKRHPGVKEASERATLALRQYKNKYVSAIRQANATAGPPPTTQIFQSSELLHPFLLAANYPNASPKLLEISFKAMRLLLEANAIVPTDAIHLVRVWMIQAQVVAAHYQKHYHHKGLSATTTTTTTTTKRTIDDSSNDGVAVEPEKTSMATTSNSPSTTSSTSSSWFFWYPSSSSTTTPAETTHASSTTTTHTHGDTTLTASSAIMSMNAVSSSTGKTGLSSTSSKEMEKLALDILSSLLQLMQGLHRNYPQHLVTDDVLWKHAFAVVCLCLSPYMTQQQSLPTLTSSSASSAASRTRTNSSGAVSGASAASAAAKRKSSTIPGPVASFSVIQQAAHSTLSQILCLLYDPIPQSPELTANQNLVALQEATWQDLLRLSSQVVTSSFLSEESCNVLLQGVLALCKSAPTKVSTTATGSGTSKKKKALLTPTPFPPSPSLALSVLTKLWRNNSDYQLKEALALETLQTTAVWLRKVQSPATTAEATHAILQWSFLLLSKLGSDYPTQSHPVLHALLQLVVSATESCRSHPDFEDGFVYSQTFAATTAQEHGTATTSAMATSRSAMTNPPPPQTLQQQQSSLLLQQHHHHHHKPLIVERALGKASLALDILVRIWNNESVPRALMKDRTLVAILTETMSDFATLGASSKAHIIYLVDFVQSRAGEEGYEQQQHPLPTSFTRKLENDVEADWETLVDQSTLGEALWIALSGVLRMLHCARQEQDSTSSRTQSPVMELFGPSLAVFQHYLKRFSGCDVLVRLALEGYLSLARLCFPSDDMQKALLTSLCKLSLPSWGKHDAAASLEDHHIAALLCLFEIIHHFYSHISTDWEVVFMTLENLSALAIASPMLTEEAYHAALILSSLYGRVAAFSTCFSADTLLHMVRALCQVVETSLQEDPDFLMDSGKGSHGGMAMDSFSSPEEKQAESFSRQIMNMGVRAIYGSSSATHEATEDKVQPHPTRTRNRFYEEYRMNFLSRISKSKTTIRLDTLGRVPFTLALIADVAMANTFRYKECGEKISGCLSNLAARSAPVRPFLMDTIGILTMSRISHDNDERSPAPFLGPGRIVFCNPMQSQLLAVERVTEAKGPNKNGFNQDGDVPQTEALGPLCESLRTATKPDVAESSLETLYAILETAGHNLSGDVWSMVISSLSTLSGADVTPDQNRTSNAWSKCALDAFRCLKLIVNDFIDELHGEAGARKALLDCCFSFGSSKHDVNSSLTAIAMLWTIADQDKGTDSIDRALAKLVLLASDSRPEVRNASVNTLFSCIHGRGGTFTASRWESMFRETLFKVYEMVTAKVRGENLVPDPKTCFNTTKQSRYKVSLHHSQDTESKQWITTQVVVLRGLSRLLRTYFKQLLGTTDAEPTTLANSTKEDEIPWFQDAWVQILDYAYEAAAQGGERDTLETRSVGVDVICLCCQLSSEGGIQSVTTARVSTNMEVVDGALRAVNSDKKSAETQSKHKRSHSSVCEVARQNFFLEAFGSLESYVEFLANLAGSGMDDTQIQVVHKFSVGLTSLYACSKNGELQIKSKSRCIETFDKESKPAAPENEAELEGRFVKMLPEVVRMSTTDISARFLNQAQRGCLQLLKTMGKDGSCEAVRSLVDLGGSFFFIRKDPDGQGPGGIGSKSESVGLEAVAAVGELVADAGTSAECKCLVLEKVLQIFQQEGEVGLLADRQNHRFRIDYKRLIPVIACGLEGCSSIEEETEGVPAEQYRRLVQATWNSLLQVLSFMVKPVPMGQGMEKISRVQEVVEIVKIVIPKTPVQFSGSLCEVLARAASNCLEVAELHERCSIKHTDKEVASKSKRHRDELIQLFGVCFEGSCKLRPDHPDLRTMSRLTLEGAVHVMFSSVEEGESYIIDAALYVCQSIRNIDGVEALLPGLFPSLCKLISSEDKKVRMAVAETLGAEKTLSLLQTAQTRFENAEKLAKEAEDRADKLSAELVQLKSQNERLRRDFAVLEASSGL